jgi:hypothetical protein
MAEFYNMMMVRLCYPDPDLPVLTGDVFKIADEIKTAFANHFRSVYDQRGGIVFEDGSSWHPVKFENSKGAEY